MGGRLLGLIVGRFPVSAAGYQAEPNLGSQTLEDMARFSNRNCLRLRVRTLCVVLLSLFFLRGLRRYAELTA
jgi:hypothetical protein